MKSRRYTQTALPILVSSAAPSVTPIVCALIYPLTTDVVMAGVPVVISGRISRPGTVEITGLGAATITGLTWSYTYTPIVGDIGPRVFSATATDAENGTTSMVSVTVTVVAAAVLPGGVTPLAWFRRTGSAYSDTAGTVPATLGGTVRRVNNVSPLTGYWQSPAGGARLDPAGLRLEPMPTGQYPLQFLSGSPGTSLNINNCTFVVSWVQRYTPWTLILAASPLFSISPSTIDAGASGALTGFATVPGARHTMAVSISPTGIKAKLMVNGVVTGTLNAPMTIAAASPNAAELRVGHFQSYAYGSITEMVLRNSASTDGEIDSLMAYTDSIPAPPAYPLDRPLLAFAGDSNTVGFGADPYDTWKFYALRALRATYDPEMACTAIPGWGVNGHAAMVTPFYDARRAKNIVVLLAGTNEFALGYDPVTKLAEYLVEVDAMRAQGWRVVAGTIQDRNGLFVGADHASYEAARATFNAGLRAASARYDALVDIAAIPGVGNFGDADGANFGPDHVHFSAAGYALINPAVTTAVQGLLAAA